MPKQAQDATPADLVVLSFLRGKPMHGYALTQELIICEVEDWGGISRPQVYYSLRKLDRLGWIKVRDAKEAAKGPQRRVYAVTRVGARMLRQALLRTDWATQRPPNPFITWVALAGHIDRGARRRLVDVRRAFLIQEIEKEERTLMAMANEAGWEAKIAKSMIALVIRQFRLEVDWLAEITELLEDDPQ